MDARSRKARPNRLGRVILRRTFDASHPSPRPHRREAVGPAEEDTAAPVLLPPDLLPQPVAHAVTAE